jgi:NAD(P)-dependent dehydrogenase (short-subunit alcohol dehydrogenase family)
MAWYTHPSYVAYTAAKAGVIGMTRALAAALGPAVRVNAVCPGFIDTAIWQRNLEAMEPSAAEAYAERIRKMHPVERRGTPEDIAASVTFLCSEDASFITGTHLIVDGGVTTTLLSDR